MAYYKLRLDVWCDWDPEDSDLEEIAQNISAGDAICTTRKVIAVVDRPQDIEDEAAMLKELAPAAGLSVVVVHHFLKTDP